PSLHLAPFQTAAAPRVRRDRRTWCGTVVRTTRTHLARRPRWLDARPGRRCRCRDKAATPPPLASVVWPEPPNRGKGNTEHSLTGIRPAAGHRVTQQDAPFPAVAPPANVINRQGVTQACSDRSATTADGRRSPRS